MDDFSRELFRLLIEATQKANLLASNDIIFCKSLNRNFSSETDRISSKLLGTINLIIKQQLNDKCNNSNDENDRVRDINEHFPFIVDTVDMMLEKIVCE